MKRVKDVIELLQFIKQDHPNPSEYMKPRVKALAELTFSSSVKPELRMVSLILSIRTALLRL